LQLDSKLKLKKLRKEFSKWKENPPAQEYLAVYYPAERISLIDKNRRSAYLWKNDNQGKTRSQTIYLDLGGKKPNGNFRSDWFY
jgi:hypothetical protein